MNLWLIQRATIRIPLAEPTTRLSEAVRFDYMGSSEFEFGTLPASLRRLQAKFSDASIQKIPDILDGESQLRVFSYLKGQEFDEYVALLKKLRESRLGVVQLKERSEFSLDERPSPIVEVKTKGKKKQTYRRDVADFWWDIENDVMFTFNKLFANRLTDYLTASFAYMDAQKKAA